MRLVAFKTTGKVRLAERMLLSAKFIKMGPPNIYQLRLQVTVDEGKRIKRCAIGKPDLHSAEEKVIMVLGALGLAKLP